MAKIEKLVPGQVLYSVERRQMGNTVMRTSSVFRVVVKEIDPEGKFIVASWNGNAPRRMYRVDHLWTKKPVMVRSATGAERLATRAEIKAMKEADHGA